MCRGSAQKGGRGNKGRGQGGPPGSPGGSGDGKRPGADDNEPHDPDWPHSGLTLQVGRWVPPSLSHPSCIRSPAPAA